MWDNSKKKRFTKNEKKGLVRVEWSLLDVLNRIAIRQPLPVDVLKNDYRTRIGIHE